MVFFKFLLLTLLLAPPVLIWRSSSQESAAALLGALNALPLPLLVVVCFAMGMLAGAILLSLIRPRRQPDKWC